MIVLLLGCCAFVVKQVYHHKLIMTEIEIRFRRHLQQILIPCKVNKSKYKEVESEEEARDRLIRFTQG
jgi:hypothetical protein